MSDEAFSIMRGMDMKKLENQVAVQCAPLLAGVKPSNLLNVQAEARESVFRLFSGTPVSCRVLYEHDGRISVLLYRKEQLEKDTGRPQVRKLLKEYGITGRNLEEILDQTSGRYQRHMEGKGEFPHEIGLLLGYPEEDVKKFIRFQGKHFLCSGYWKVYGNLQEALKTFASYDRARETVIRLAGSGRDIREILVSSRSGGYRGMNI